MKRIITSAILAVSMVFGGGVFAAGYIDTEEHWAEGYIDMLSERGLLNGTGNGYFSPEEYITAEQLTAIMLRAAGAFSAIDEYDGEAYKEYALKKGIITDYDVINWNSSVNRSAAARIIHQTMYIELGERDEDDWSAAQKLADLYSCSTCVNHIAQVYVKGIMQGREDGVFDLYSPMTRAEAAAVTARMTDRELRLETVSEDTDSKSMSITYDDAVKMIEDGAILIDVRSENDYGSYHLPNSINIPLQLIIDDITSFPLPADSTLPLIVYCQYGVKSAKAAELLAKNGRTVYDLGGLDYIEP